MTRMKLFTIDKILMRKW